MNVIVDWFKNLFDNIRERVKNPFTESNKTPFAATFIFFFIICHWEFFFDLIAFDANETREAKIKIIKKYFEGKIWWDDIIWPPILCSFISIFLFYTLNNLSLAITTVFNKWAKPFIYAIIDRNKIVTKEEYEKTKKHLERVLKEK